MKSCSCIIIKTCAYLKEGLENKRVINVLGGTLEMLRFQNYKDVLFEITKPYGFLNLRLWVFSQWEIGYLGNAKRTCSCQGFGYQEFLIRNMASEARRKDELSVTQGMVQSLLRGETFGGSSICRMHRQPHKWAWTLALDLSCSYRLFFPRGWKS